MNKDVIKTLQEYLTSFVDVHLIDDNVETFAQTCTNMIALYAKKNHDYGNSFEKGINTIGIKYSTSRLFDKMNRILTLSDTEPEIVDETIEDTLLDLACYSVMTLNCLNKKKND